MGGESSRNGETAPPRSSAFERKKQQAAERMFRNHYNKKHSNILISHSKEECRRSEFDYVRKLAFTDTETHRGLRNLAGENNCFLNATIQALWHLGPFRYQMQKAISINKGITNASNEEGTDKKKLGLFDALCNLFIQYQYTELKILPPTEVRTTMSELFDQFQLGKIADANETLEAILETIHVECTPSCSYRKHNCLAHTVFGGLLMEQSTCLHCSSRSAPMLRSDFVHYVYAAELIALGEMDAENRNHTKNASKQPPKKFGHLLHECMGVSPRCCPSLDDRIFSKVKDGVDAEQGSRSDQQSSKKCDGKATVKLYALEPPMALAISVGWTQSRESATTLHSLLSLMSYTIELSDLFDLSKQSEHGDEIQSSVSTCNGTTQDFDHSKSPDVLDLTQDASMDASMKDITESLEGAVDQSSLENKNSADSTLPPVCTEEKQAFSKNPSYVFRGFVCYYGLHYISILQESNNGEARFLLFDDQKVRPIGGWEDVKKECMKSLYQPVLLLYELQDSNTSAECLSHPHSTLSSRPHPDGVPETKESGSRNLCCSSSSSSSSTARHRVSDINATASISALHTRAERHHAPAVTSSSSRPCASYSGKHHVPPLMAIKTFEKRFVTSYVTLEYEKSKKRKLLGFQHNIDPSSGRIVITGFHPHPKTGKMLPAEASGQISLWDQLLAIDNTSVENYSLDETTRIFKDLGSDSSKNTVLLTLRSAHNTEVWYRCPYCDMEERLSKSEEYRLREIYEHVLPKDFNEGTMLGDSLVEGEKSILTQCRTCTLRGSARKLLESNIFS